MIDDIKPIPLDEKAVEFAKSVEQNTRDLMRDLLLPASIVNGMGDYAIANGWPAALTLLLAVITPRK